MDKQQLLMRYLVSGSWCPISFFSVAARSNGAVADDLWYHAGEISVFVSKFLCFFISSFLHPPSWLTCQNIIGLQTL